jgi:predicted metal-dependent hydrolase
MPNDRRTMSLERGLELIRTGGYFKAHEELEDEWREAPDDERDFLQGLVHVAVAWLHAERSNRPGCERQLEKAARRLGPYEPEHRGVDVTRVLADVASARRIVERGSLDLPEPRV